MVRPHCPARIRRIRSLPGISTNHPLECKLKLRHRAGERVRRKDFRCSLGRISWIAPRRRYRSGGWVEGNIVDDFTVIIVAKFIYVALSKQRLVEAIAGHWDPRVLRPADSRQ